MMSGMWCYYFLQAWMKTFVIEENFPCTVQAYFRIIYEKPDFKQRFHSDRGDQDVEVSEWIEQGPPSNSHQRICFYSMVEKKANSNPEVSRCLETERYEWQKDQNAEETVLQVYSSVTPENSMGNIFNISANWMVSPGADNECKVWLESQVECTKKVWGLQNIAEGYLYSMVSESMKEWFKKSHEEVLKVQKESNESAKDKKESNTTNQLKVSEKSTNEPSTAQHIRMRAIGEINTVVSGTGKLVQMLSSNAWPTSHTMDEEALQGSGENILSHFVIETPHLHADDDLDANGQPIKDKIRIPSAYLFSVLFVILVVLLVYLYINHAVII